MDKKYTMPLQLFVILEKVNPIIFTSEVLVPNHYIVFVNKKYLVSLSKILKNEFFTSKSALIENSCVDTLFYNKINNTIPIFSKNRFFVYYIYYLYTLKMRLTIIINNDSTINNIKSIDFLYKNANWLERESSEMYGLYYSNKKDSRKLLLDYTKDENPMLKDFPTEGTCDIFYNIFEDQVVFEKNNIVEL